MKKFLSLLLAGVMALTMMTGCQQETNTPAETPAAPAESTDFPQLNDKPAKETEVAVIETEAGCTISSHCGPGTLGVLFIEN